MEGVHSTFIFNYFRFLILKHELHILKCHISWFTSIGRIQDQFKKSLESKELSYGRYSSYEADNKIKVNLRMIMRGKGEVKSASEPSDSLGRS